MTWELCTSGSAIDKAGLYVNSGVTTSGSLLATWNDEAQDMACAIAAYDVVTNYSSLTNNGKKILGELTGSLMAQKLIGYTTSGYTNSREAETSLDILESNINRIKKLLEDGNVKAYLGAT